MNGKILIALVLFAALLAGCVRDGEKPVEGNDTALAKDWGKDMIKLTWVGPQKKVVPSMGIGVGFDAAKFADGQPSLDYSNDRMNLKVIEVSEREMEEVEDAANSFDFIKNEGGMPAKPALSHMYYDGKAETVAERVLDAGEAKELAEKLQTIFTRAGNAEAVLLLEAYK